MNYYQRLSKQIFCYTIAIAVLCFAAWVYPQILTYPTVGMDWEYTTGEIGAIAPNGQAGSTVEVGDVIRRIDGKPVEQNPFLAPYNIGEVVTFEIIRGGELITLPLVVEIYSWQQLIPRLLIYVASLAFSIIGGLVYIFRPASDKVLLFFAFFQSFALALLAGSLSTTGAVWVMELFGFSVWWAGLFAIHFHLNFPLPMIELPKWVRRAAYATIAVISVFELTVDSSVALPRSALMSDVRQAWISAAMLVMLSLLIAQYARGGYSTTATQTSIRQQMQVLLSSTFIAIFIIVAFAFAPDLIYGESLLTLTNALAFIILIPISYGYSIIQHRLISLDTYVSRSAVAMISFLLLIGATLLSFMALQQSLLYFTDNEVVSQLLGVLISVLLMIVAYPYINRAVNLVFYGGWYDYRSAVEHFTAPVPSGLDQPQLGEHLLYRLQAKMQFKHLGVMLYDTDEREFNGIVIAHQQPMQTYYAAPESILTRKLRQLDEPTTVRQFIRDIPLTKLPASHSELLLALPFRLWIPLRNKETLVGILMIGTRRGDDIIPPRDQRILRAITRYLTLLLQNARLITALRAELDGKIQLYRQHTDAREAERKRIARELHDDTIQSLIGFYWELSRLRRSQALVPAPKLASLEEDVKGYIEEVRRICHDLRPPMLDTLGLVSAVRTSLRDLETESGLSIRFATNDAADNAENISEEVGLCAFRVVQETVRNSERHAAAERLLVHIAVRDDALYLHIEDDGRGFDCPDHLDELMQDGHYGLVGLRERIDAVNGSLAIDSEIDNGTRIDIVLPLSSEAVMPELLPHPDTPTLLPTKPEPKPIPATSLLSSPSFERIFSD